MVVVVMVYLGRCRMGPAERRTGLGVAGLFLVAASGFAAYGICSAFGEMYEGRKGRWVVACVHFWVEIWRRKMYASYGGRRKEEGVGNIVTRYKGRMGGDKGRLPARLSRYLYSEIYSPKAPRMREPLVLSFSIVQDLYRIGNLSASNASRRRPYTFHLCASYTALDIFPRPFLFR